MANDLKRSIREFIEMSFLFREGRVRLGDEESLLAAGLIDSTGILELVSYLESQFGIVVEDEEIVPENLDSVSRIADYVAGKQEAEQVTAIAV
ncbi:MAG: acyl carrier protein [Hyphomicrobium sp.]|uniref:acyl carrier protein n=1 Tax=Hyphomicrobium sp. TaxID=82 RepID=UPI0013225E86|nr:phosphopantetheine-binding protein [Hyphomicrobium sp.]KAB2940290.1 MAG: acyl carrier protein [Hyphomicrobium sp.]MBZ0211106.1 acyl carrier protein [Hyphomicrobium sp.]